MLGIPVVIGPTTRVVGLMVCVCHGVKGIAFAERGAVKAGLMAHGPLGCCCIVAGFEGELKSQLWQQEDKRSKAGAQGNAKTVLVRAQ